MNALDVVVFAAAALAVIVGWKLGFMHRVASWLGSVGGVLLAMWLIPFFRDPAELADGGFFIVLAAALFGAGALGNAIGSLIGRYLRSEVDGSGLGYLDSVAGVAIGLAGLALMLWVIVPPMSDVPGWPARTARSSWVGTQVVTRFGTPPDFVGGLSEALGVEALPQVFNTFDAAPEDVAPPPPGLGVDPALLASVERSTVRVESIACGGLQSGSGFLAEGGWIITNAHVVAGATETIVVDLDGTEHLATLALMDTDTDIALLRAPTFDAEPLSFGTAEVSSTGVALGYPGGGTLERSPFVIDQYIQAVGRDLYDRRDVSRDVFVLGAELEPGDSGGALIATDGSVVGATFAIAPDRSAVGYAIAASELSSAIQKTAPESVADSGACLHDS